MVAKQEIDLVLKKTDELLGSHVSIILIGGVATVAYGAKGSTYDADSLGSIKGVQVAWQEAERLTGIRLPLSQAGVADGPYNMESRLVQYRDLALRNLSVYFPEIHDLALMKIVRLLSKDMQDIQGLHSVSVLGADVMLERYLNEMGSVIGNRSRIDGNYLVAIETLFGTKVADDHETKILLRRP